MTNDIRQQLIAKDHVRKARRQLLQDGLKQAKHDLHPKTLANRWLDRKKAGLAEMAQSTRQNLEKNAPIIGVAGLAVLLFSARKPISRLWTQVNNRTADKEQQNEQTG